ncbi:MULTISPECIES: type III secretion system export apparatus subunit SctR [Chromobacterium]|uniref:EscR/YscR/HrcR family type III secretion system export apparatus protein n=2 Tax=Chromobacterium TaxID=535 RepID=A0A1S1WX03_9NEIS|nr:MULTISPECIES: type III secretion system export apparatus subunit SctR [Chromobacterium]KIA79941.1 type III secretion system protein SsaR [Chromobacterium piscinae]MBM2883571.1 type III secretion system export apparatus subunit SctR [Chromobacterium amazonense]MDE1715388.1 type III secretion system export apparatus subunit SctR [Chromobacterium amazonense]MDQ4541717.1 type III secretion system export apparatus subunit SctR [Chromobacterium amazonense]OHX11784.1 EscR/YscR/HrcR family type III
MSLTEQPVALITLLAALSLLPLLVVMGTSFLKLSVVFALLRNALGVQQIPPNIALYGLALILSLFIMTPVGMAVQDRLAASPAEPQASLLSRLSDNTLDPYRQFLKKHTAPAQLRFFRDAARKNWPDDIRARVSDDSLLLLMPAFAVSQLIEAFKIGLLLFLPFIAIDLIVSNVLLAMGMMMVSPMTISMPFKLLVFVLVGGWDRLLGQLLLSYR